MSRKPRKKKKEPIADETPATEEVVGTTLPEPEPVAEEEEPPVEEPKAEVKPATSAEIDRLVYNFINKCERGQVYTVAEVAEELGLTTEQVQEALTSLQPTGHIRG